MKVGILGVGQLGQMLEAAGRSLGMTFRFLDPSPHVPTALKGEVIRAPFDDPAALERFRKGLDVVTYEFENIPVFTAEYLEKNVTLFPPVNALQTSQDRLLEKNLFNELGIPTTRFASIENEADLLKYASEFGFPCVLKTRRLGYDGKGQRVLRRMADVSGAWSALGSVPLILEEFISFEREVSLIAMRSLDGNCAFYPLVENEHRNSILRKTTAPAPRVTPTMQKNAETYVQSLLAHFAYVGVFTLELFVRGETLIANETAPRVHNSGHWSIEGAITSQFENHVRAVTQMPLGSADIQEACVMLNIIGRVPDLSAFEDQPGIFIHLYGKNPKPGRKLGHITILNSVPIKTLEAIEGLLS